MPLRTNLADAKNSRLPNVVNLPKNDTRFVAYLNEAIQRLLPEGKWRGTVQKFYVCATDGRFTWAREWETIEAIAICNRPIVIRNQWFEFNEFGFGVHSQEPNGAPVQLLDEGTASTFADIPGSTCKIRVTADESADNTAKILIKGRDIDGNIILTDDGAGGQYNGEIVLPGHTSVAMFVGPITVQKPVTQGYIRLGAYDTVTLTTTQIAAYQPSETNPIYRRSLIPGLSQISSCAPGTQTTNFTCSTKTISVLAKMAFVPVSVDTDWLLINSLPALKCELQCIRKLENNLFQEAAEYHAEALRILDRELQDFEGDSVVAAIRMPSSQIFGGGVENIL